MKPREPRTTDPELQSDSHSFGSVSYLYGGTIAVIISWLMATMLTGCRFGNYTSTPSQPSSVTGYYAANPQSVTFCTTGTSTTCTPANTSQVPSFISDEISNPVALIVQDDTTGDAVLTAATGTGQTALPIWVNTDNVSLYYDNSTDAQTLWQDPTCTTTTYLDESGTIVSGTSQLVPGTSAVTQGSLTLKVQVIQTFDSTTGSCGAELQLMSNCYQNVSQCGGADSATNQQLQAQVQGIFSQFIQAGAMAATDISSRVNVSYEVHYQ